MGYYWQYLELMDVMYGKGNIHAKFTINPVTLVENYGLKPSEIKMAESVIEENAEIIAEHWNKFFNNNK